MDSTEYFWLTRKKEPKTKSWPLPKPTQKYLKAEEEFTETLDNLEIKYEKKFVHQFLSVGFAFSISTNEFLKSSWLFITYDTAFIDLSSTLKKYSKNGSEVLPFYVIQ
ncbi:hypothetical protein A0J50_18745 (plasmid) [Acinetobacter sp. DUT-2]|nr:hypothetical protein A0J50_18745 [Acinetobacter sp. DUT-2]